MSRFVKKSGKSAPKRHSGKKTGHGSHHHDWLYGRHAVRAALENPRRHIETLHVTSNTIDEFTSLAARHKLKPVRSTTAQISALLPPGAVHQGIAAKVRPLAEVNIRDLPDNKPVLVLDQVTDPHNVGAILRSAAVFNASAIIMTRRNSPPLTGVLAKSACGALEFVAVILTGNLSRALSELGEAGFWIMGLAGEATDALEIRINEVPTKRPVALVLGAEDKGMRRLTIERCDEVCHITTRGQLASLNVSNAAAIALHTLSQRDRQDR